MHNILVREKDAEMKEDEHHLELGSLLKRKVRVYLCAAAHTCSSSVHGQLMLSAAEVPAPAYTVTAAEITAFSSKHSHYSRDHSILELQTTICRRRRAARCAC